MNDKSSDYLAYDQRVIRVFVSSTFRDMQAERDELIKQTFPRLRKLCDERNVVWSEVDLRWGITQEQSERGEVLPICLAEIQRCRPYFIGLLGERYGWIPDEIPTELIEQEKWLEEHLNHSVTELEILHGVLNDPKMNDHALFYFRDAAYLESLSDEEKSDFTESASEDEIKKYGQAEAEKLAEERKQKLVALKDKIKEHCEKNEMPTPQNYPNPKELGEMVWRDMSAIIERLYPKEEIPEPLDRESSEHEAFAQSRKQVYIGRQSYFDRLDAHARSEDQPLVILGESGLGKSALLANWALQYREKHAEDMLIMHFIGATPYSADWVAMLRRIMGELKRRFDIQQEIPDKTDELKRAFANFLYMAAAKGRCVIILDALNQLEDRDGAPDLVWLDFVIPPNVRMILSTLPGRPLDNLKERGLPTLQIEPLNIEERQQLIPKYLAQFSKSLDEKRAEQIANAEQTANPLFLRALLDELRVFGIHEKLDERIAHYLEAKTVDRLYEKILTRYEQDYERERPALVKDAMSLIWASRRGLSEAELLDLLGEKDEPLPRAFWSPLYLAAESSLVSKSGLINFAHNYFREAVRDKYLATEEKQQNAHLKLADYFEKKELDARKIDELPWQLTEAKSWQRVYDLLADRKFFIAAWNANQFEIKEYWTKIEADSPLQMVEAYQSVLDNPEEDINHAWLIGTLFGDTGHLTQALSLRGCFVEHFLKTGDLVNLQASLASQALMLRQLGEIDEAMRLHKESEHICRQLDNKEGLSISFGSQASILYKRGKLDEAMRLHKEEERIYRELGNNGGLSTSLGNQALIFQVIGESDEAMKLHKEEERLCRQLGDKDGLSRSFGNQAIIFQFKGELDEAIRLHKESERICRELGNKEGISGSLGNQAVILYKKGKLDEAMKLHKEEERLCRQLGDKDGLSISLGNQALILESVGDLDGAIRLHKEGERICCELGNKDGLSISLGNQAVILQVMGRLNEAMRLHKEEERICRELGNKDGLSRSLGNQALILKQQGEIDKAMRMHKEQEHICRELNNKEGLSITLGNQALILADRGKLDEAMRLHKEEERICRELGNKDGLSRSLGNQALILKQQGEIDKAMQLYKQQERLCRELGNKDRLVKSLINQVSLLANEMRQPQKGIPLAEEAYELAQRHGLIELTRQIELILDYLMRTGGRKSFVSAKRVIENISIPQPHPNADPNRAAQLNIEYNQKLAEWQTLPWWKRLWTKKPERPTGI